MQATDFTIHLSLDKQERFEIPVGEMKFFDAFYVDCKAEEIQNKGQKVSGTRLRLSIHPKEPITLKGLTIVRKNPYLSTDKIFCNGYQSWSESREFNPGERIPRLRRIARPLKWWMGDEFFSEIRREKGFLHSWTYSYVRSGKDFSFVGSLNEKAAFNLIQHDTKGGKLIVQPDCEGLVLEHSFPIIDLVFLKGDERGCFDTYFDLAEIEAPKATPAIGWTSWYHYYTDISEEIILKNLDAWKEKQAEKPVFESDFRPAQIFQIDDGWQTAVGDWLSITDKFPSGMTGIARSIKQEGYIPGLWLAPFICDTRSNVFKNHKSWLLKDKQGIPLRIGYNPLWKGGFYALDFYQKEVQDYLTKVLMTVLDVWGYGMLKLDFLYAVCLQARPNRTRGQNMYDAMSFLRNIAGDRLILGCGVPLGSCFGLVDYCRIGADIHLEWEHKLLAFLRDRERVSTIIALRTTLGRYHLNGRAFHNDPDVFLLRKEKQNLTPVQQDTILKINALLGNLVFTSDYLADYDTEQTEEFFQVENLMDKTLLSVEQLAGDRYKINFVRNGKNYAALCNLHPKEQTFTHGKKQIQLQAYETIILQTR